MVEKSVVDELLDKTDISSIKLYNKAGALVKTLSEEEIKCYSQEVLEYLLDQTRKYKDFGMGTKVLQQLIEIKKAYWPAVTKNIQSNINLFDEQLEKWKSVRKELKEIEKESPIIISIDNNIKEPVIDDDP
jgi:DNA-binding transcriptional MerR regulator